MNPFFVTGLPRSRTAWLANYLTTDRTLCYHDRQFDRRLLLPDRTVGFSGPELCEQYQTLASVYPDARWLAIMREPRQALESFTAIQAARGLSRSATEHLWKRRVHLLLDMGAHQNVQTVPFASLDQVLPAVWKWLLPGIAFDAQRTSVLLGFNVQQVGTD